MSDVVKHVVEGDETTAKANLVAKLDKARDEVLSIAKTEVLANLVKGIGETK